MIIVFGSIASEKNILFHFSILSKKLSTILQVVQYILLNPKDPEGQLILKNGISGAYCYN